MKKIHILFPVLNEEKRLEQGIINTVGFMDLNYKDQYKITIIDNGSDDLTEAICSMLVNAYSAVNYIKLLQKGVGLAFREGVKLNDYEIVGYMDIDLSTKIDHLIDMYDIFMKDSQVQIVNGSRLSKNSDLKGRKPLRQLTSFGLKYILKIVFGTKIDDALCGFKFFRKNAIEKLIRISSNTNDWFYCAELLLRAEKCDIQIREIPVVWRDDHNTTVNVIKLIRAYLKQIFNLFIELRIKKLIRNENQCN